MEITLKKEDWKEDEGDGNFFKYKTEIECPKCGTVLTVNAGLLENKARHFCHKCFEKFEITTE